MRSRLAPPPAPLLSPRVHTIGALVALALAAWGLATSAPRAALAAPPTAAAASAGDVVIYLVRHAETEPDGTRDPALSAAGRARARLLAAMLRDAGVTHVHSTDLRRTRQTGAPFMEAAGLELESYDPRDPEEFARTLRATPGRHLVLGHSNTTPALVAALGGDPGTPIAEDEHDRLYVLVMAADGVRTILLRYGSAPGA